MVVMAGRANRERRSIHASQFNMKAVIRVPNLPASMTKKLLFTLFQFSFAKPLLTEVVKSDSFTGSVIGFVTYANERDARLVLEFVDDDTGIELIHTPPNSDVTS